MAILKHPDLPGQTIVVRDDSVWHYQTSGWVDVNTPDPPPLEELKKDELAAELEARGLSKTGTKAEMIARLDDSEATATEPDGEPAPEEAAPEEPAS